MKDVFDEIIDERIRQDNKWGEQNHNPFKWLAILGEEVGEVNKAWLEYHFQSDYDEYIKSKINEYRKELIQVAAVAIAMIESFDRNEGKE